MKKKYTLVYRQYFENYLPMCEFKKLRADLKYEEFISGDSLKSITLEGDNLPDKIDVNSTISTENITDPTMIQYLGIKENTPVGWFKAIVWPEIQNKLNETEYDEDYL